MFGYHLTFFCTSYTAKSFFLSVREVEVWGLCVLCMYIPIAMVENKK